MLFRYITQLAYHRNDHEWNDHEVCDQSRSCVVSSVDGNRCIRKPTAWYVYGNGLIGRQDTNGAYQSYHYDRRGSTLALTDAKGQLTDTYSYGTYGESLGHEGTTEQPFQYNGRDGVMTDPNGLYQMRARYYNPEIKRFVNRDVLSGSIDDGLTMNRYAYVNGNPISYIDPFGLSADSDEMLKTVGSGVADAIPYLGTVKAWQQEITGVDYITGQQLTTGDRVAETIGGVSALIPIPGAKYVGKYGTEVASDAGSWVIKQFGKGSISTRVDKIAYNGYYTRKQFRKILHNAIPTNHGFKHLKAKTINEAQSFSITGRKQAQYLPGINNTALKREALWKGNIVSEEKGAIYFIYDTGKPIGYDLGIETSWIRTEITSGGVFHGYPIAGKRLEEYLGKAVQR
ncbi:RHS repeat-associated core domain-containing protein [Paenibacillus nuruki]|nr:RHS repeat-associated core domain-containing protein [Paenibacillus nuruki]